MSTPTWGLDPKSRRIKVYYDGTSTIAEGMPVCYNYLTTDNWLGVASVDFTTTASTITESGTTAEGGLNEGKFIRVCNPICVNSTTGTFSQSAKTIDDDGNELDNIQVGMMVSVASITDSDIDGNWKVTAVDTSANTITLDMTDAEAAAVTDAIADCHVRIDNIGEFAGVVAGGSPGIGVAGPGVIDIYVANGAIVPVKTVLTSTVAGRTILSIVSSTQTLGNPTDDVPDFLTYSDGLGASGEVDWDAGTIDSKPVAVAAETISSAGLVLAKLDDKLFMHQGGQFDHLLEVGAGAVDVTVNKAFLRFNNTAGNCQALHYCSELAGTGGAAEKGVYRFETIYTGVPAANKSIYGLFSHVEIGAGWGGSGDHCSPLKLSIRTKNVDPDLSSMAILSAINIDWILRETTTGTLSNPPNIGCIMYLNHDSSGTPPDVFIRAEHPDVICQNADGGAMANTATCALFIKITVGSTYYYIPTFTDAELTG